MKIEIDTPKCKMTADVERCQITPPIEHRWNENLILLCPHCENPACHIDHDAISTTAQEKTTIVEIPVKCETGCSFRLTLQYHKGVLSMGATPNDSGG